MISRNISTARTRGIEEFLEICVTVMVGVSGAIAWIGGIETVAAL
jgi:hypothetical protein